MSRRRAAVCFLGGFAIGVALVLVMVRLAVGADCGGIVQCQCGDSMVENYTMTADLICAQGQTGIQIRGKDGLTLDCDGHLISGPPGGWRTSHGDSVYGVYVRDESSTSTPPTNNTVQNCRVTGFQSGIRVRTGVGNSIRDNVAWANGDPVAHDRYNFELSNGPTFTTLDGNESFQSADEGMHIGTGSNFTTITNNHIYDNFRENLYILESDTVLIEGNTLGGTGGGESANNALFMKGASNWTITGNTFNKRPVHVTKDSNNNTFTGNTYLVGAFVKIDYCYQVAPSTNCKDPATNPGGTYFTPSNTLFSGETITGNAVAYCLYVSGATGTRFVDSAFANCGKPALQFDDASGGPGITTDVTFISGDPFAVVAPRDVVVSGKVRLAVGWKLDVLVRNEAAAPLEGVRLLAVNSDGSTLFDLTTDAAGEIPQQEVIVRTGVNAVLRTPFTINAMRSGYTTQAVRTSPTANTSLTIDMVRNQ